METKIKINTTFKKQRKKLKITGNEERKSDFWTVMENSPDTCRGKEANSEEEKETQCGLNLKGFKSLTRDQRKHEKGGKALQVSEIGDLGGNMDRIKSLWLTLKIIKGVGRWLESAGAHAWL